ncbi:MAG: hypothetical protein CBB65_09020 [Hyphomonadaceae bacterium TMED5]|nr:hypothetical protein [Ponticaulis sp.]OUX99083.1 MAG: hypothetical protein CBB65_09020 [Hyphomonadaceae bacterium TMED5]
MLKLLSSLEMVMTIPARNYGFGVALPPAIMVFVEPRSISSAEGTCAIATILTISELFGSLSPFEVSGVVFNIVHHAYPNGL